MTKTILRLSRDIGEWAQANFGNTPVPNLNIINAVGVQVLDHGCSVELNWMAPLLGMGEEIGELAKQVSVLMQWIDEIEVVDAIADIGIYFCDYLHRRKVPYNLDFATTAPRKEKHLSLMLSEAYGGLLHCELKRAQRIRGMDDGVKFWAAHEDATAKLYHALQVGSRAFTGQNVESVISDVFRQTVAKRDWKKNKESGAAV